MKKEDIFYFAEKNGVVLTDSQFRRYVQYGLISSERSSKGKGKGVKGYYPFNSLEIITEIVNLKALRIKEKDLIVFLFSRGYVVNNDKLKRSLIDFVEEMLSNLNDLLELVDDEANKEWILDQIAEENLPKQTLGRPSKYYLNKKITRKKKEEEKLLSILNVINEIFSIGHIKNETTSTFLEQLGYTTRKSNSEVYTPQTWMNVSSWAESIQKVSVKDISDVQLTLKLIRLYEDYFKVNKFKSKFIDHFISPFITMYRNSGLGNPLLEAKLLKLLIVLFLVNPELYRILNNILSLNGNIRDSETLSITLPLVLQNLDKELVGGLKINE